MNIQDLYQQRESLYIRGSKISRGGIFFCILMGLLCFFAGLQFVEQTRVWGAVIFNLMFFFALAMGGSALSAMQDIVSAVWGRPIMRLHEAFTAFLPVASAILIAFFICIKFDIAGAGDVYRWMNETEALSHFFGKRTWLQEDFFLIRNSSAKPAGLKAIAKGVQ